MVTEVWGMGHGTHIAAWDTHSDQANGTWRTGGGAGMVQLVARSTLT